MIACHKIITPNCHKHRGSAKAAVVIALQDVERAVMGAIEGYGTKANIHIKVEIERIEEVA